MLAHTLFSSDFTAPRCGGRKGDLKSMPEGYTHIRTARAAARLANIEPADSAAFGCGANGPDMLFCYRVWRKSARRGEDLPKIGDRLHYENTGAFLRALLETAKTPAQRSYALGFLCHYAADCALHPYVVMITEPGAVYGKPGGHGYFEIALDSFLHQKDTGNSAVPVNDNTPALGADALEGVAELLQAGIRAALGISVSRHALKDSFAHTRLMRGMFVSRLRIKYALFWLVEPLFGGRGFITGHITPAHLRGTGKNEPPLPEVWKHPFTGEEQQADLASLLELAERTGAAYMMAAQGYWQGKLRLEKAMEIIGSKSYLSGLEDEKSAPHPAEQPAEKASAEQIDPEQESEEQELRWRDIDISAELDHNSVG